MIGAGQLNDQSFMKWQMLADHLRTKVSPQEFSQKYWCTVSGDPPATDRLRFSEMPCGTTACLWGHATDVWPDQLHIGITSDIHVPRKFRELSTGIFTTDGILTDSHFRCKFFGITLGQELIIFGSASSSIMEKLEEMRKIAEYYGYVLRLTDNAPAIQ